MLFQFAGSLGPLGCQLQEGRQTSQYHEQVSTRRRRDRGRGSRRTLGRARPSRWRAPQRADVPAHGRAKRRLTSLRQQVCQLAGRVPHPWGAAVATSTPRQDEASAPTFSRGALRQLRNGLRVRILHPAASRHPMANLVEFFRWWVVDDRTGERRLTTYKLSRADALRAFPGCEPNPSTREVGSLPDSQDLQADSRPGIRWS